MKKLAELQAANLDRATVDNLGMTINIKDDIPASEVSQVETDVAAVVKYLNEYLEAFTPGDKCPLCDATIGGLLGSFMWGMANGKGFCSNCNYPVRAYHETKDGTTFERLLAVHPSLLEEEAVEP